MTNVVGTADGAPDGRGRRSRGDHASRRHELRERMARTELHFERVTADAGAPLAVHANATITAGGKRLRPLLVVLAAESAGGPEGTVEGEERLVRAAVAVELVHSATLVHDDLIDGAQLRRGQTTVAAAAGREAAVATGDLLFSRAFAELARNEDEAQLRALSDASSALAAGELLQREDAYASRVTVDRYLRRCELKTAALFEAACRLGALVAVEGSAALADALGIFARRIGLAFQLLDDVLDVSGPVERTGKSRGTRSCSTAPSRCRCILARERDRELSRTSTLPPGRTAAGGGVVRSDRRVRARSRRPRNGPRNGRGSKGHPPHRHVGWARGASSISCRRGALPLHARSRSRCDQVGVERADEELDLPQTCSRGSCAAGRRAERSSRGRAHRRAVRRRPARTRPRDGTSHSGQRSTMRQWRGPSSDQSSG